MFEQSLYEPDTAAQPPPRQVKEDELFGNYELRTWDLSPRLYKILGVSALANIVALLIVAQTSLLTVKGCDSPLVGSVCQALDTVYVGALLFGTKRDYVDQEYDKIDLGNSEITYVDLTNVDTEKLYYPSDYLKYSDPDRYAAEQAALLDPKAIPPTTDTTSTSGFPNFTASQPMATPNRGKTMFDTRQVLPKPPKRAVIDADLPDINGNTVAKTDPGTGKRTGNGKSSNGSAQNSGNTANNGNSNTEPKPTTDVDGNPIINSRPFADLGDKVNGMLEKNEVKLDSAFTISASGKLTKDGRFDEKTFKIVEAQSQDAKMIEVIRESINAINASGYLTYLSALSGKDFNLMMQQDDQNITAVVQSEMESVARANSIKSGLDLAIGVAKMRKTGAGADQNDKDDLILLEGAKIDIEGKKIIIRFVVPKETALPMIQRKLAEQKLTPKQPNGNAVVKPNVPVGK